MTLPTGSLCRCCSERFKNLLQLYHFHELSQTTNR